MPSLEALLVRLRDPAPGGPLSELAALAARDLLARPAREVVDPPRAAAALREALAAVALGNGGIELARTLARDAAGDLRAAARPLEGLLPPELAVALRELAARPYAPDRAILLAVLDREPVRALLREILTSAFAGFGKRLAAPVSGGGRGLAALVGSAAAGVASRSGALGALAGNMVGAVAQEVERQVEQRARELADAAVSGVLRQVVDHLSDPARALEQAALRRAVLDGVLALGSAAAAGELDRLDVAGAAEIARRALSAWAARPEAEAELARGLDWVFARLGDRPLAVVLEELGARAPAEAALREALLARMRALVDGEPFAAWLAALCAE